MDEEKLISLVQQNECLWASANTYYKNQYMRQKAWNNIAGALNSSENEVKKRWRSLRDTFSKKLHEMNQPSGSGYKHIGWKYFQQMAFLKDCYDARPREGNIPIFKDPMNVEYLESDANNNEEFLNEDESDCIIESESQNISSCSPTPSKKRKPDPVLEELLEIERGKQQALKTMVEMRQQKNSNYLFFTSLVEPVDSMPLSVQLRVKEKIMKVVHDAMLENQ